MALPPGLILNPATGELTGVPTQAGTFTVNGTVRDTLGTRKAFSDSITIAAYTPMELEATLGAAMDTRPLTGAVTTRTGGQAPYAYTIQSGTLPSGIALDPDTGELSGTPIGSGAYAFTLRVTDQLLQTKDTLVSGEIVENLVLTAPPNDLGTVGVAQAAMNVARAGGSEPFEYALVAGTLPAGMTFNADTGSITGTPTAAGNYTGLIVEATDANGFTAQTAAFALDVKAFPTLLSALTRGTVNEAYSSNYVAGNGHLPYSFAASSLPPGLSVNTSTGVITGTPTAAGSYNTRVTLTDAEGNVVSRTTTVVIAADLTLTGTVPPATRAVAYSFRPTTTGGWPGYTYTVQSGTLPAGLSLNSTTGLISGTPTTQSENSATVRVTDADGGVADLAVNISVSGDIALTGTLDPRATTTVAYADNLGNTGGTAPFAWSISVGALPPGITMNTGTGAFSGTPTAPGTYNFTVRVRDANASYAQTAFSITVAAFPNISGAVPDASVGQPYSVKHAISGGHAPLGYSLFAGTLPGGLSLNASTGVISGTPTTVETDSFTIRVTDDAGNVDDVADSIQVFAAPSLTGSYDTQAEHTVAYSDSISVTGGKAPLVWSIGGGSLPDGLSINNGTGAITGTPTGLAGTYGFTVRVVDALGRATTSAQSITVRDVLNFTGNRYQSYATQNVVYSPGAFIGASGGWGPLFYDIVAGSLPPGININTSTGALSGTPTTQGAYTFTVRATDALGKSSLASSDTITVRAPVVLSGTAPKATKTVPYSFTLGRTGGWGPFAYSITAGGLPAGLTLNTSTGVISGTPSGTNGTASLVVRCIDNGTGGGSIDTHSLSIVVALYPTLVYPDAHGTVGRAFSVSPTRTGGHSPFSYALVDGSLPAGTSLNTTTGVISGTPTTAGDAQSRIRMTDGMGNTVDEVSRYTIAARVTINSVFASPDTEDTTYSSTISASGGWAPRTFAVISGTLPPGLSMSSAGTLSGTSTTPGTYNFTVRCTDADGNTGDRAMSVTINAAVATLVVTASPNPASDYVVTNRLPVTASASSTASTTGGTGSKTFSWVRISADSTMAPTVSGASTSKLTLSITQSGSQYVHEVWRVTARDGAGTTDTYDVTFNLIIERESV